jgi:hypothetical protein
MPIRAANQPANAGSSGGNRVIYDFSDKKVAHRNSYIRIRLSFCLGGYIEPFPVSPFLFLCSPLLPFLIHNFSLWNRHSSRVPLRVASSFRHLSKFSLSAVPLAVTMEKIPTTLPFVGGAKEEAAQHPIGPLTASEITRATSLLKASWPANTDFNFKAVTLLEPLKAELLPYLQAERSGSAPAKIDRRAFVLYYIRNTVSNPKKPRYMI